MVLVLFLLSFAFLASWQQEITEKSLNEMLDQLIEETSFGKEKKNNSRIIYIKPENITTRRVQESSLNTVPPNELKEIENLIHQIEHSQHEVNYGNQDSEEDIQQKFTVDIERTGGSYHFNNDDGTNYTSGHFKTFDKGPDDTIFNFLTKPDSDSNHKYPEIIIDKITYDTRLNKIENKEESAGIPKKKISNVNRLTSEEKEEVATRALDSLVKILMKTSLNKQSQQNEPEEVNSVLRSTRGQNNYHNHVIDNVPLPYHGLSPHEKMLLEQFPDQDLHHITNRQRNAYIEPNFRLTRWQGNAAPNSLVSISRAPKMNQVHFIPQPLIVPRFVFQPVFHRHQYLQ